jgi:hypothetical protein
VIDDLLMESFLKASLPSWLSGLFILLVVPFFFVGGPDALSSMLLKNVWNFGHIIFFTVFMLLVQSLRPLGHWHSWLCVTKNKKIIKQKKIPKPDRTLHT